MAIPLPLPIDGADAFGQSMGGAAWIAGTALHLLDGVDQFRRGPSALPPVTGQDVTLEEMIRDYAAGAAIGVGAWPPGPPDEPDPRLSVGLWAAASFGAWNIYDMLRRNGPEIEAAGANMWNWLNRNFRGFFTEPVDDAPQGTQVSYTLSPRRVAYYLRGTYETPVWGAPFGTTQLNNIVANDVWFDGYSVLLVTNGPTIQWAPPGTLNGYSLQQFRIQLTGTNSSGATVTISTQWYQGITGTVKVNLYPNEQDTTGHVRYTNLVDMSAPYTTPVQFERALLPAWRGPAAPVLPMAPGLPFVDVPQALPLDVSRTRPPALQPVRPATPMAYPLEISRPAKVQPLANDGKQLPLPLEQAAQTAQDARQYGSQSVTAGGPRTDTASIAAEIGRIERKLGLILPKLEGADLRPEALGPGIADNIRESLTNQLTNQLIAALRPEVPGTTYGFTAPCDRDLEGLPIEHVEDIEAADFTDAVLLRLDAIAAAMAETLHWRRRLCKGTAPRANVTVTAYED